MPPWLRWVKAASQPFPRYYVLQSHWTRRVPWDEFRREKLVGLFIYYQKQHLHSLWYAIYLHLMLVVFAWAFNTQYAFRAKICSPPLYICPLIWRLPYCYFFFLQKLPHWQVSHLHRLRRMDQVRLLFFPPFSWPQEKSSNTSGAIGPTSCAKKRVTTFVLLSSPQKSYPRRTASVSR